MMNDSTPGSVPSSTYEEKPVEANVPSQTMIQKDEEILANKIGEEHGIFEDSSSEDEKNGELQVRKSTRGVGGMRLRSEANRTTRSVKEADQREFRSNSGKRKQRKGALYSVGKSSDGLSDSGDESAEQESDFEPRVTSKAPRLERKRTRAGSRLGAADGSNKADVSQKDKHVEVSRASVKEEATYTRSGFRRFKNGSHPEVLKATTVRNRGKKSRTREVESSGSSSEERTSSTSTSDGDASSEEYQEEADEDEDPEDIPEKKIPAKSVLVKKKAKEPAVRRSLEASAAIPHALVDEEICSICEFAGGEDLMLLCDEDGCTCALHTFCLNPPLQSIPEGEWLCPHCADEKKTDFKGSKKRARTCSGAIYPPKVIDSIIGRRTEPLVVDGKVPGKTRVQYLVKWNDLSHRHDSWIPDDWLLFMDMRLVMSFQRKYPLSDEITVTFDDRKQEWSLVDRVLECRRRGNKAAVHPSQLSATHQLKEEEDIELEFLVKWKSLDYISTTWEKANEIEGIEEAISDYVKRHERGEESTEVEDAITPVASNIKQQPDYISGGMMYGFQLQGLKWLLSNFEQGRSVILADEMGLGKTVQTLAFISSLRYEKLSSRPVLVIAPKSTLPGWQQELRSWAPGLNAVVYQGEKENRMLIRQYEFYTKSKKPLFDVLVTSYELATFDNSLLAKFHWASLIVDEGHRVKNVRSKLGTLLKRHRADFRLLLTGTPVQNTLTELFSLLHFLDPSEFPDPESSARQFTEVDVDGNASGADAQGVQQQVSRIHELLRPRMLRRLKAEVLSDMIPGKKLVEVSCALTSFQRHLYVTILKKNYKVLNKGVKSGLKRSLNTVLTDLKMVCNHPYLFPEKEPKQLDSAEAFKMLVKASGKLQLLEKLLPRLKEGGHRVLLFSQMTKMLDILEDFLSFLDFSFCRIDGSTSAALRQKNIAEFNTADSSTFVFLISTRAGGLGINLPTADTVIIYDPDFNPFVDLQAQARAHRIGQSKSVLVYQLITKCSVEEKILQRSRKKLAMENLVMATGLKETVASINTLLLHGAQKILDEQDITATSVQYTDDYIKRLLDREMSTTEAVNDAQEHGYLGAVQGSDFMSQTDNTQEEQNSIVGDGNEWQELFKNLAEQDEQEELGRGKRVRKQVMYAVEANVEGHEDDEYDPVSECESSSSSDLSMDSEGLQKKKAGKKTGLLGRSVQSMNPEDAQSDPNSSRPWMTPYVNMISPVMSAAATSSYITESTPGFLSGGPSSSRSVGFVAGVYASGVSGGAGSSQLGSVSLNISSRVESGQLSTVARGFPYAVQGRSTVPSATHSQNSDSKPYAAMYPFTTNVAVNTSTNPYMSQSYPGIPPVSYFPYNPQFLSQPLSSRISCSDGQMDAANGNLMSNPPFAVSNLHQTTQSWKPLDSREASIYGTPQVARSGGVSNPGGYHDSKPGQNVSRTIASKTSADPNSSN